MTQYEAGVILRAGLDFIHEVRRGAVDTYGFRGIDSYG